VSTGKSVAIALFTRDLRERLTGLRYQLRVHVNTITVVEPGAIAPSGGDAQFAVFTLYYRRWLNAARRDVLGVPARITVPDIATEPLPSAEDLCSGRRSPHRAPGGETAGRRVLSDWLNGPIRDYEQAHDDLAGDGTSRLDYPNPIIDLHEGSERFRSARTRNGG
jgi:deoxyribodipyrimidine photo-lyase